LAAQVSRVRAQHAGFSIMTTIAGFVLAALLAFAAPPSARAVDGKIAVGAAENFYGDIARQIGGDWVAVVSIMNNPDQDPHLFETTPGIVKQIAGAQIAIVNGADYDPWMEKLLSAAPRPGRLTINVAALTRHKAGDNPHLWYDPSIMVAVARLLDADLAKADRTHSKDYDARLASFEASLKPINDKIAAIRGKYAGTPVTASEPVFGYMAQALGLKMRNERFQLSIMNDTELAAWEHSLDVLREQTAHLLELCDELHLIATGSSDYHGPTHKTFSRFGAYQTYGLGEPEVPPRP